MAALHIEWGDGHNGFWINAVNFTRADFHHLRVIGDDNAVDRIERGFEIIIEIWFFAVGYCAAMAAVPARFRPRAGGWQFK